jgi:uncharacterized membrane protein YfcA
VLAALPLGLGVGLTLGAVGGGGAVLAVPLLVFVLGQDVHAATTTSLVVVAAAAMAGGGAQAGRARVCWSHVRVFAPAVVAGSFAGTLANEAVNGTAILIAFVPMLLSAAWFTWRRTRTPDDAGEECPPLEAVRTLAAGSSVGVLTAFFGVGGGFLIVPMLALALRFPLRRAIGTSLVIIGLASVVALAGHLWRSDDLNAGLTIVMAGGCAVGAVAGTFLGARLPQRLLGSCFAILVAGVGAYVLVESTAAAVS